MYQITILLASYNGEAYIEQQILSLLAQTYKDWVLYIRDDGSFDKTVDIIEKYVKLDDRIILVKDSLGGLGCSKNFLSLLKYSQTEFTIFCDQDDIWLENKLEVLVNEIIKRDNTIPQLVYSKSYTYNPEENINNIEVISPVYNLQSFMFRAGGIQGCASIFNSKLKELILIYKGYSIMHDFTLTFLALLFGEITLVDCPLTLYRIHSQNVTGERSKTKRDLYFHFFRKSKRKGIINKYAFRTMCEIAEQFNHDVIPKKKKILDVFFSFPDLNKCQMIFTILKYRFTLYGSSFPIVLKVLTRKTWEEEEKFVNR